MGTFVRGIKNISRNKIRNLAIILVLSFSLSLGLMMINMDFSASHKVKSIKEKLGTRFDIQISSEYIEKFYKERKGARFKEENPFIFEESLADDILKIDSVKSVSKNIGGNFSSKKLKSHFKEMMERFEEEHKGAKVSIGTMTITSEEPTDAMEVFFLKGIEEANMIPEFQDESIGLVEGNLFGKTDIKQNVALIEKEFARRNNLNTGSEIIINGEKIRVCGIYESKIFVEEVGESEDSYFHFTGEIIYTPFKTAQRLLDLKGKVSSLTVTVDSIDNVEKTIDYINNVISDGKIIALQDTSKYAPLLSSINSIKKIAKVGMISAFAVGILIILSIMFINVRGRAKEIGILKAIGASNANISTQFLVESMTFCIIALILSLIIILGTNQLVADFIVEREKSPVSKSEYGTQKYEAVDGVEVERFGIGYGIGYAAPRAELGNLEIIFSSKIFIYAILITFLLGAIGSVIPTFYISKLRPAEVLRFE